METAEEIKRQEREYRERTKSISSERLSAWELHNIHLAVESLSLNVGKRLALIEEVLAEGLTAIALAASTPDDNSAQVKEYAERIKRQVDALKSAEQQSKGE